MHHVKTSQEKIRKHGGDIVEKQADGKTKTLSKYSPSQDLSLFYLPKACPSAHCVTKLCLLSHSPFSDEVISEVGIDPDRLTVDQLAVQADSCTYHRFDRFNEKYSPAGESRLRDIFLKTSNALNGRYLAELTKVP